MFFANGTNVSDVANLTRAPANNMFLAYFTALENASVAFAPMKSVARAQAEMIGFMSRRARACLEAPAQLTSCRNPHDILHEQMRFWDLAAEEYKETSRRILEAWQQPALAAVTAPDKLAPNVPYVHDYIEFPVAKRAKRTYEQPEARALNFA